MLVVGKLNIGSLYLALGDNVNSMTWISEALDEAILMSDTALIAKCYINVNSYPEFTLNNNSEDFTLSETLASKNLFYTFLNTS